MKPEEALKQIEYLKKLTDETRIRVSEGYPFFLLWGALWILGYTGSICLDYRVWYWIAPLGGIVSGIIGWSMKPYSGTSPLLFKKLTKLSIILGVSACCVFAALITVSDNLNPRIFTAFWPFQVGVIYMAIGLFMGKEMVQIGGWLVAATIISLWLPPIIQQIWLAVLGGGALLFTGLLLLRQAKKNG